jgi:hypothetical protein
MRELSVRQAQLNKDVSVEHIEGKRNIADIFTKEMKDTVHFQSLALTITSPRRISELLASPSPRKSPDPVPSPIVEPTGPLSTPAASAALATVGGIEVDNTDYPPTAVLELARLLTTPGAQAHLLALVRVLSTQTATQQTAIGDPTTKTITALA